ncbi:hypothetical protein JCM11491_006307 [Sporobolomyces phaffii]
MDASRAHPRPPTFPLDPHDLQRWIRFSAKGGVGRAKAIVDRASEDGTKDLMMLEGDEVIVLMDLGSEAYLGHCEGVVGLFRGQDVRFLQPKLKKPVMTPRDSAPRTSKSRLDPSTFDPHASASPLPGSSNHPGVESEDACGSSRDVVSDDSPKAREEEDRRPDVGLGRGRTAAEIEGLGITVKGGVSKQSIQSVVLQSDEIGNKPATSSPDLAGAFRTLSHALSTPPLDDNSSDHHTVPSLLTSPYSDTTSYSGPRTPYTPGPESRAMGWVLKELPATPDFAECVSTERIHSDSGPSQFEDHVPTNGFRPLKTSNSTVSSQSSRKYTLSPPSSAPNSLPGTPGDDPTLAFIFDSYRVPDSPLSIRPATQRRTKSSNAGVKGLVISPPVATSMWRSPEFSPVTQTLWTTSESMDSTQDVFVDSPISSQSHGRSIDYPSVHEPSRALSNSESYPIRHFAAAGLYTPSPSSISFQSFHSIDDVPGSLDHSSAETSDNSKTSLPNKLRKKASFRLRNLQSSPRTTTQESRDPVNLAAFPLLPPPPSLPTRLGSDPFYASSPPASPARQLSRKNSVGSKFSRKSSEKDKKVTHAGAGISSKDFEEETVQIGASAFEMVKPYAALLSLKDDERKEERDREGAQVEEEFLDYDRQGADNPLATPLRSDISTPQALAPRQVLSHFSPPTPLSAEGGGRSVEDHRAKEQKWIQTLSSGLSAAQVRKSKKMRSLVYAGIPSSVRGKVWSYLAEVQAEKAPGLYRHLCSLGKGAHSPAIEQDLLDNPQLADGSAGCEDLLAVLNAFAQHEPQLGYYPGLARIAALLLTQMIAEDAFFTLLSLVKNYGFRQFFAAGREELRLETIAFQFLLEMVEPKIARRFRELEIGTVDYLFSWISTFFLSILPLPTVLRIVDVFLLDPKTRYRAPLAILHLAHYPDSDLFPSRDSVLNHLLAPPPSAFSPAVLLPAVGDYKLSDDKVQKAIKKAAQVMLAPH